MKPRCQPVTWVRDQWKNMSEVVKIQKKRNLSTCNSYCSLLFSIGFYFQKSELLQICWSSLCQQESISCFFVHLLQTILLIHLRSLSNSGSNPVLVLENEVVQSVSNCFHPCDPKAIGPHLKHPKHNVERPHLGSGYSKLCLELGIRLHHHGIELGWDEAQVALAWCTSKLPSHKVQILRFEHLHLEIQILLGAAVGQKPSHLPHTWHTWPREFLWDLQNHRRLQIQRIRGDLVNFLDFLRSKAHGIFRNVHVHVRGLRKTCLARPISITETSVFLLVFCQASKLAAPWRSNSGCTLRHPFSVFVCHTQSSAVISKVCPLCFSNSKSDWVVKRDPRIRMIQVNGHPDVHTFTYFYRYSLYWIHSTKRMCV